MRIWRNRAWSRCARRKRGHQRRRSARHQMRGTCTRRPFNDDSWRAAPQGHGEANNHSPLEALYLRGEGIGEPVERKGKERRQLLERQERPASSMVVSRTGTPRTPKTLQLSAASSRSLGCPYRGKGRLGARGLSSTGTGIQVPPEFMRFLPLRPHVKKSVADLDCGAGRLLRSGRPSVTWPRRRARGLALASVDSPPQARPRQDCPRSASR